MRKEKLIILSTGSKARFILQCSKYLSDFLNTKIPFQEVSSELMLYELRMEPANAVLSHYVISYLKETTINNPDNPPQVNDKPLRTIFG